LITKRPRSVRPPRIQASPRMRVSEMQRARLLSAAVAMVDELGYAHATVAHIAGRARVSRRTFYDLFENREACLLAVIEDTVARVVAEFEGLDLAGLAWRERVRMGLWTVLCFCEREPVLARVCLVHSVNAGQRVLAGREEVFALLAGAIDEGRGSRGCGGESPPVLVAEGLVGAVVAILCKRLQAREREPLGELLGALMSMIVLPYQGPAVARRERVRPVPEREPAPAPVFSVAGASPAALAVLDPLRGVPMRLTYRTALVLEQVAAYPGASNRVVGERAGVPDQGQISKLLARLERLGLLANTGAGPAKGESNAWRLTPLGEQITRHLSLNLALGGEDEA
jgi:AcrR family transcriptional regulator